MAKDRGTRIWHLDGPALEVWYFEDVMSYLRWDQEKLYRMVREGHFPRPMRIGTDWTWTGQEIAAYLLLRGRWYPGPFDEDRPARAKKGKAESPEETPAVE